MSVTVVDEWRRGILPGFHCPACMEPNLMLCNFWNLWDSGVSLTYTWICRTPECKFVAMG